MIKFFYKLITLMFTAFIIFVFMINFNFISFKVNILLRIYYAIKINLIYFLFYTIYICFFIKYYHNDKKVFLKRK